MHVQPAISLTRSASARYQLAAAAMSSSLANFLSIRQRRARQSMGDRGKYTFPIRSRVLRCLSGSTTHQCSNSVVAFHAHSLLHSVIFSVLRFRICLRTCAVRACLTGWSCPQKSPVACSVKRTSALASDLACHQEPPEKQKNVTISNSLAMSSMNTFSRRGEGGE